MVEADLEHWWTAMKPEAADVAQQQDLIGMYETRGPGAINLSLG